MQRNFDRRVEFIFHIEDFRIKEDIIEILKLYLTDTSKTWVMNSNGNYTRKEELLKISDEPFEKINIQDNFVKKVIKKYEKELKDDMRKKVTNTNGIHKRIEV